MKEKPLGAPGGQAGRAGRSSWARPGPRVLYGSRSHPAAANLAITAGLAWDVAGLRHPSVWGWGLEQDHKWAGVISTQEIMCICCHLPDGNLEN